MKFSFTIFFFYCTLVNYAQGPEWSWAKWAGGSHFDMCRSMATDSYGNLYVAGYSYSPSLHFGDTMLVTTAAERSFLVKYDSAGNVIWARSGPPVVVFRIDVDFENNILMTGHFIEATVSFDNISLTNPDTGALLTSEKANFFLVKFDQNGNTLWAKTARGNSFDSGNGLISDIDGSIYVMVESQSDSISFDSTNKFYNTHSELATLIVKYSSAGDPIWARSLQTGGTVAGWDLGNCLAPDGNGNVYTACNSLNKTLVVDGFQLEPRGWSDIAIIKLGPDGHAIWAKSLGGSNGEYALSISANEAGGFYMAGLFYGDSTFFEDELLTNNEFEGGCAFLGSFDDDGNLMWIKQACGSYGFPSDVATDKFGNVILAGAFLGEQIQFEDVVVTHKGQVGDADIFLFQFDKEGNPAWGKLAGGYYGGSGYSKMTRGLVADDDGDVYLSGNFIGPVIEFDDTVLNNVGSNSFDMFIARISSCNHSQPRIYADGQLDFCEGGKRILTSSSPTDNYWTTGVTEPSIVVSSSGRYSVTVQYPECKLTSAPMEMNVKPLPPADVSPQGPTTFCEGNEVVLTASLAPNYSWSNGSTSQSIVVSQPGGYWLITSAGNGCTNSSDTVYVNVNARPDLPIMTTEATTICAGQVTRLIASDAVHYKWSTNDTTRVIEVGSPGDYRVAVTDVNGCSALSDPVRVFVEVPLGPIELKQNCDKLYSDANIALEWYWNNEKLNTFESEYFPSNSGIYFIEASNACGRQRSNSIAYKPISLESIFLPSVITPNNDKYNDYFVIDEALDHSEITIYNRWGSVVFFTETYTNNWDGDGLSMGTYFYTISNRCFDHAIKGTLTILK